MISAPDARTSLEEAQCLEISGEDARSFAQGQFSGDVRALQPLHWQWNAWLDHRGAVRALMHLADAGDGRLLALMRGGCAEDMCTELRKYVLRARVLIRPLRERFLSLGPPLPLQTIRMEAAAVGLGCGEFSLWIEATQRALDGERERAYRLSEIRHGWPRLPPGHSAQFLPPALGLERLGAVSFAKGCYPGQEIAARLHYRGGHKLRLTHVRGSSALHAGAPLREGTRDIVLQSSHADDGWQALAVMDESPAVESSTLQEELRVIQRFDA